MHDYLSCFNFSQTTPLTPAPSWRRGPSSGTRDLFMVANSAKYQVETGNRLTGHHWSTAEGDRFL